MPEEYACEVGVATQQQRQFIQSCQVLFQWDRNSCYWHFLSGSERSALAGLHKKAQEESEAGWGAWQTRRRTCACSCFSTRAGRARACKSLGGCLFSQCIVKVEGKGTAHAPLPGLDPVARVLHSSAEKCVSLPELSQMKAALPGSSSASGPCFWKSQPCCFSLGLISGLRRIG